MKPIGRRALLRGAGVALPLPFLEAMVPRGARAAVPRKRFVALTFPNGSDAGSRWHPAGAGSLEAKDLTPCLQDLAGFAAERDWPSAGPALSEVTLVSGIDHEGVCAQIHNPSMSLCAHTNRGRSSQRPPQPTLDQYLADRIGAQTPFRSLTATADGATDLTQGCISFRANGQAEAVHRSPAKLFDALFADRAQAGTSTGGSTATDQARALRASILDWVKDDARRLTVRLGSEDRRRIDQYLQAVSELERQIAATAAPAARACAVPERPGAVASRGWNHAAMKQLIDLTVLALACDLTNVVALQYGSSWRLDFKEYALGDGVGSWSDHFVSHKLDDRDRATDLDGLPRDQAKAIADARVVQTSRFKVRRMVYLINALKRYPSPSGTLLDESLVLITNENGNGDSHSRRNMPIVLAGHAGGFKTGRRVAAPGAPTGALHASILRYFDVDVRTYGDPAGAPIAGL